MQLNAPFFAKNNNYPLSNKIILGEAMKHLNDQKNFNQHGWLSNAKVIKE